jgi:hypothetical protein
MFFRQLFNRKSTIRDDEVDQPAVRVPYTTINSTLVALIGLGNQSDAVVLTVYNITSDQANDLAVYLNNANLTEVAVAYNEDMEQVIMVMPYYRNKYFNDMTYHARVILTLSDVLYQNGYTLVVNNTLEQ